MMTAAADEIIDGSTVTVPGTYTSPWDTNGSLTVGLTGTGTLIVETAGIVASGNGHIALSAGSIGAVTVRDAGSNWNLGTSNLYVGYSGGATLNVQAGGAVTSGPSNIGYEATSNGTATVTGQDSTWNLGSSRLTVGYSGTGALNIEDGGTVTSGQGYLGSEINSSGTVNVTGTDSAWNLGSGLLVVGDYGTGTLTVSASGSVTSGDSALAQNDGSTGTATVTGTDSTWNLGARPLYVGISGGATLNIEDGGTVTSGDSFIGYLDTSNSTATVTGQDSTWNLGAHPLSVGYYGTGALNIEDGGTVTSTQGYIGLQADSSGTVSIAGTSSVWDLGTSALSIGYDGEGALTIRAGGSVRSGEGVLGQNSGSTGSVTVTGASASWNLGTNSLYVGLTDEGTLRIENGGTVLSGNSFIGYHAASDSTATVTGSDSTWDLGTYSLSVGYNGTGTLHIEDGGRVTSGYSNIGVQSGSNGTVVVTGGNSIWDLGGAILGVGYAGTGTLTISAGGSISSGSGVVGYVAGSTGTATVTGAGSIWNSGDQYFYIGQFGAGTLTIENGGEVRSAKTFVGNEATGSGTLYLNGTSGARGVLATGKVVKGAGAATLNLNGGILKATDDEVDFLSGFATGDIVIQAGGVFIDTNSHDIEIAAALQGAGGLTKQGAGTATFSGVSSYAGATRIEAGTLALSGALGTGAVSVVSGATLMGSGGSLGGAVTVAAGGTLAGGQDGAGLTMAALVLDAGAITDVGLSTPTTASAVFTVTGDATINGTLNVTGLPGYGEGVYRVVSTGGALADNGLVLGTTPPLSGYDTALDVGGQYLDVQVTASGGGSLQYWSADGVSRGGSGSWTSTNPWLDASGGTAVWGAQTGVFSGTAGTVSVVGTQSFGTLEFLTTGYVVQAGGDGALNLGEGGRLWAEGAGTTATISAPITGGGALTKIGAGTVILTGTNTYQGGTVLSAGTLQVSSDANLGAASGALVLNGGELATTASFTSARTVSIGSSGGTVGVQAATELTLSGVISGEGALAKEGAGTLILTGTNTYTGGTTINAGILQLGDGGTSGSIVGNVVNNASLVFNRSDTYAFPGTITGDGTVKFIGGGTVLFSTPGAYSGAIEVENAAMILEEGSVSGSSITVGTGGSIGGNGTIGGLMVNAGGIAAPGNSPGTIAVNGAVSFNAGSVYRVDVTPAGQHDLITATGAVTIDSGASVQVIAEPGTYDLKSTYAIITTTGTLTGTFGSVTSDYAFLTPTLSYDAQNVYLNLYYNGTSFASFAQTSNQVAVANAVQALGIGNALFEAVVELPAAAVPAAFGALSGDIYPSIGSVIQQQSVYVRDAVNARLRQSVTAAGAPPLAYGAMAAAPATAPLGNGLTPTLWAQGYGGWGNTFGNGNAATVSNNIGGVLIGADVALGGDARAGLFGGFSQSQFDVDSHASTGSMDNYDIGGYVGAQFGAVALRAGLSYAWHDVSVGRTVAFPGFSEALSSGSTVGTTQVFGELGYDVAAGAFAFEPFAGLAYVNSAGATFSEGYGSAALSVDTASLETLYSTLGVRAAASFEVMGRSLTPSVALGWQHAFGDTTSTAAMVFAEGSTPFQVSGAPIAVDALLVEAGLSYTMSSVALLSVNYSGQIASNAAQNAFTARFALRF